MPLSAIAATNDVSTAPPSATVVPAMSKHANWYTRANLRSPPCPISSPASSSRGYYDDVVGPLIGATPHAAGRLGWGSDVLGFDTERSTDHGWGPHLHVFVAGAEVQPVRARIDEGIPQHYLGWPTRFGWDEIAPRSWVEVFTLDEWLPRHLGCDPRPAPTTLQWLVLPQQLLLEVVGGGLFHDDVGSLTSLREELAWYPDDVWLWLLACQWQRIGQEEAFVGRTAEVGDELGSSVLAARLTRDLMRLCFLIERRYAPYSKWFGTAFRTLDAASEVGPLLENRRVGWGLRSGRSPAQRSRSDRVSRAHLAALLWTAVSGDLRRAVRGRVPGARRGPLAALASAHRRDRPVVRLNRCALGTRNPPPRRGDVRRAQHFAVGTASHLTRLSP